MICDVILMTIYLALFVLCISFAAHFFDLSQLHYLFNFSDVFVVLFLPGFVVAMLSIHTVDHWVVFDTIYIQSATPI